MTPTEIEQAQPGDERRVEIVMVIEGHDWREKVIYHGAERRWAIERAPQCLVCLTCGFEKQVGVRTLRPCHEVWSERTGLSAIARGGE